MRTIPLLAATAAICFLAAVCCCVAYAADNSNEQSESEFLREVAGRLAAIERRIRYLDENLERTMHMRDSSGMTGRSSSPAQSSRMGDFGTLSGDYMRTRRDLDRLQRQARGIERDIDEYDATHGGRSGDAAAGDKAGKSRRRIEQRVARIESDIDQLERELRYLR